MKIGQKIVAEKDISVQTLFSDEVRCIKKGTEGIVTADGSIYWNSNNITIDDIKVEGYDRENIAEFIINYLIIFWGSCTFETIEETTGITIEELKNKIEEALSEIL